MAYMDTMAEVFQDYRHLLETEGGQENPLSGSISMSVSTTFSLHTGDMKIMCTVVFSGGSRVGYRSYTVSGPNFGSAVAELLHRVLADDNLQPICLPRVSLAVEANPEAVF